MALGTDRHGLSVCQYQLRWFFDPDSYCLSQETELPGKRQLDRNRIGDPGRWWCSDQLERKVVISNRSSFRCLISRFGRSQADPVCQVKPVCQANPVGQANPVCQAESVGNF